MIKISSDCCLMFSLMSLNGVSLEYSDIAQRAEITQAFFFLRNYVLPHTILKNH